jgi:RNase P/RNase MRP subunit POP5
MMIITDDPRLSARPERSSAGARTVLVKLTCHRGRRRPWRLALAVSRMSSARRCAAKVLAISGCMTRLLVLWGWQVGDPP